MLTLGKVVGVFGVRGWVKVYSETRPREQIFAYSPWTLTFDDKQLQYEVVDGRQSGKSLVAQLQGVDDRDAAQQLIGAAISCPQDALPATGDDEFYWTELVGLEVVNEQGVVLGKVSHLFETGANDVLVVKGERERLLPFTAQVIRRVDLENGRILVDWDADF
jgi:16S rRNA processing protein RimM